MYNLGNTILTESARRKRTYCRCFGCFCDCILMPFANRNCGFLCAVLAVRVYSFRCAGNRNCICELVVRVRFLCVWCPLVWPVKYTTPRSSKKVATLVNDLVKKMTIFGSLFFFDFLVSLFLCFLVPVFVCCCVFLCVPLCPFFRVCALCAFCVSLFVCFVCFCIL